MGEATRPVIADVARVAGVPAMTDSRVLDDHPAVAEAARRRVAEAVVEHRRDARVLGELAAKDQASLGVIRVLVEAGRRVPEAVSVVGFDDTPESGDFLPPLTTVRREFAEVGRESMPLLIDRMARGLGEEHATCAPQLVVRASTAPPRSVGAAGW